MHPAQGPLPFIERHIALRNVRIQTVSGKFLATKRSSEETPVIFTLFQIHHESTGQFSLPKNHESTWIQVTASIGSLLEHVCDFSRLPA